MKMSVMLAALLILPSGLNAQSGSEVLERAARTYKALSSFSADFWQVIDDSMVGTLRSRGRLIQAGDARLSMRFTDPAGEAIVLDGTNAWVYAPSTTPGQVMKISVASLPDFYNLRRLLDQPTLRYDIKEVRQATLNGRLADVVRVAPKDASLPFTEATIWVDQGDGLPRRLEIRERTGAARTLTFSGIRLNERLPDRTFTFDVPAGVRVVGAM